MPKWQTRQKLCSTFAYCFQLDSISGCFFSAALFHSLSGVFGVACHKTKKVNFGFEFTQCARHQQNGKVITILRQRQRILSCTILEICTAFIHLNFDGTRKQAKRTTEKRLHIEYFAWWHSTIVFGCTNIRQSDWRRPPCNTCVYKLCEIVKMPGVWMVHSGTNNKMDGRLCSIPNDRHTHTAARSKRLVFAWRTESFVPANVAVWATISFGHYRTLTLAYTALHNSSPHTYTRFTFT